MGEGIGKSFLGSLQGLVLGGFHSVGQKGVPTETKDVHRWPGGDWVTGQGMGVRGVKAGEGVSGCSRRFPNSIPTVASQGKSGLSFTPWVELGATQDFVSNKNVASKICFQVTVLRDENVNFLRSLTV